MTNFRGWHVLGGGFINAMLIAGAAIYSFGLFVIPVQEEFGLTREQVNLGIIALYLSLMFWAPIIGRWLQKASAKTISTLGGIAFGLGASLVAWAPNPVILIVSIALMLGFGFTAAGPFLANVLAANWFARYRGRALGIAAIATSAGGFIIVPIFAKLISVMGWRTATLVIGIIFAVIIIILSQLYIVGRPEEIDQFPDGNLKHTKIEKNIEGDRSFVKRPEFWLISLGAGLVLGSDQALLVSLIPYAQEAGASREAAAILMSAITISAIAGKLVVGWLSEHWDHRLLFAAVCVANLIFLLALLMNPSYWVLMMVCALVGLAIGGVYPVWTSMTAKNFGPGAFSKVYGSMNLITIPLMLISITIAGRTFDQTGTYELAFKIFIPQVILAAILILKGLSD